LAGYFKVALKQTNPVSGKIETPAQAIPGVTIAQHEHAE